MSWFERIATLWPIGQMTAPGTIATVATIPFVYWLRAVVPNQWVYLACVALLCGASWWVVHRTLRVLKRNDDPQEIVLDEVVGCVLTFWGITLHPPAVILGFLLFRFFDLSKLAGVVWGERLGGATGIMADDLIAAVLSNIVLRVLL